MNRWHALGWFILFFVSDLANRPASGQESEGPTYRTIGRIESLDPQFDSIVSRDAKIEVIASGFTWTESPLWNGDHLLFADIPRNTVYRWSESTGVEILLRPSGYTGFAFYGLEPGSNGMEFDAEGRLISCEHGDRRVSVLTPGGGKRTLADHFRGRRFNSPNDLVIDRDGAIYFTDPIYGLPERADDPSRELDFCGVFRLDPDGTVTLLTNRFSRPNGIGLSPDERTLVVAQSDPNDPTWTTFEIRDDKTLGGGKVIADARETMKNFEGLPDGLTVSKSGLIFASSPGGIDVMTFEGKRLGRIITGGKTSNCGFDDDESNLYIAADDKMCRVRLK